MALNPQHLTQQNMRKTVELHLILGAINIEVGYWLCDLLQN
jgi:hypothetical protein